ncbi:MucB/RseB C-terminal domain-containing protein [Ningiella sp. W23]|uniref:MucB/RseB C-terminal domain-containing protein n=1 Tax=Ningiella sp. W23 TaxID=3023715 RepID=UPI003757F5A2
MSWYRAQNHRIRPCFVSGGFLLLFSMIQASFAFAQDLSLQDAPATNGPSQDSRSDSNVQNSRFDRMSALSWMERLINEVQSNSFEMVFVVSSNKRETLPYMWRKGKMPDDSVIEQLSLLNGPGFEQVSHNNQVSIFEPGFAPYSVHGTAVRGPIPRALIYDGIDYTQAYDVLLMGRNRIAGRMAQQVRIISKDKSRFGYHIWLDEQSGLLLKLDMHDLDGSLLQQIQVTQLSVSNQVNEVFRNFSVDQLPVPSASVSANNQDLNWRVDYMPKGMKVLKQDIHRIERTGQLTEYMLLSDGLVDVSVYVMRANNAFTEDVAIASNSHAVVSKTDGRVQVTVVGEIPVTTADKIAESIVLIEPASDLEQGASDSGAGNS